MFEFKRNIHGEWQVSLSESQLYAISSKNDLTYRHSGGFMGDLVFNGGKYGIWVGNQQFTVRNLVVNNAQVGIHASFNWGK
jgi:hypothetical protein